MERIDFGFSKLLIGTKEEIKATEKSMARNGWKNGIGRFYEGSPKYGNNECYGIVIDCDGFFWTINSDMIVGIMLSSMADTKSQKQNELRKNIALSIARNNGNRFNKSVYGMWLNSHPESGMYWKYGRLWGGREMSCLKAYTPCQYGCFPETVKRDDNCYSLRCSTSWYRFGCSDCPVYLHCLYLAEWQAIESWEKRIKEKDGAGR